MSRAVALICAVVAGGVVALQPPANAQLARHVSDLGAALVSLLISVILMAALLLIAGHPGRLSGLSEFRPGYAVGGIAGATIVAVSLIAVRPLGAGGLISVLVAAQLAVAVVADRYGWFGLQHVGFSAGRWAGLALVIGGTVLLTR
jgi:transporter family-2 protein